MTSADRPCAYYLSPHGDDAGPGTRAQPWRTIDHANRCVKPGDTVIFLPGDYEGALSPHRSGAPGEPVTYRSETPRAARLIPPPGRYAVDLAGLHHVVIEGFRVDGRSRAGWVRAVDATHVTARGCVMADACPSSEFVHCRQVKLLDNVFSKDRTSGDMLQVRESEHVLIEGNSFTRAGHSPLQITCCRFVVVRANCFRNDWGRNYEFWATGRILIEGNIITQNRESAHSADSRAKNLYHDGIFRFNRVFDNRHTPLDSGSYMPWGARETSYFREPFRMVNSRIYHNTISDNLGYGWELWGMNISSNVFQNNIFSGNDWAGGNAQLNRTPGLPADNRVWNNLFHGSEAGQPVIRYEDEYLSVEEIDRRTVVLEGFWTEFKDNLDAAPRFRQAGEFDYRLQADSPAVGAGRPLAMAMGEGRHSVLPVTDGVPFFDGFGIEGEQGDWVRVGDQLAQVRRVELRYYMPALLHLDREVTWHEGMPVSLPWSGKAPDLGAYPLQPTNPARLIAVAHPARPAPGEAVHFSIETPGGTSLASVHWDFEDGHHAATRDPAHAFEAAGDYGVTVRAVLENGRRLVDVVFVKVEAPREPGAPLVRVDFEDETRETEWGYHFKSISRWLTGAEHIDRGDGRGKAMRLFYDAKKGNRAAAVLAPGPWNIQAHPYVRFAYRIKPRTPVAICLRPFEAPGRPAGFILGGTPNRPAGPFVDLDAYALIDDDRWHETLLDVRCIQTLHGDIEYLYRFKFFTDWVRDEGQTFWLDDFTILAAADSRSGHGS